VKRSVQVVFDSLAVEIVVIRTTGDRILDSALSAIGGKGLFVRELEQALETGEIDIAVHSLKDLQTELPESLGLGGVLPREDVRDALVSRGRKRLAELAAGAVVATSSIRRRAQLLSFNPSLSVIDIRGNVDTRIRKMEGGDCEALVLAAAGLSRLGRAQLIAERLDPQVFMPAVGQGIIGIEMRREDPFVAGVLQRINHPETFLCAQAERALLARMEGGCQVPLGCLSRLEGGRYSIGGSLVALDGSRTVRKSASGPRERAVEIAEGLAEELLRDGGAEMVAGIRGENARG
jgi:hydroxymethylbilane synthase